MAVRSRGLHTPREPWVEKAASISNLAAFLLERIRRNLFTSSARYQRHGRGLALGRSEAPHPGRSPFRFAPAPPRAVKSRAMCYLQRAIAILFLSSVVSARRPLKK
jgi:hypothetical protein